MDKNMELIFVRHCESYGNVGISDPAFHPDDPPLTPLGLQQAQKLKDRFLPGDVSAIYASALQRACQTVEPTARKLGMQVRVIPELNEVNTAIPHSPPDLIKTVAPSSYGSLLQYVGREALFPLTEQTPQECEQRAEYCIGGILQAANDGDKILICTHGGFIGYLLRCCLGLSLPELFNWQIDNCSVFHIRFTAGKIPKLVRANDISHLITQN